MVSGYRREAAMNCALLGYHAASSGNFLPTFRVNLLVPSSAFKNPFLNSEDGTVYTTVFLKKSPWVRKV